MLLSIVAVAALALQDPPRLRTLLPNGPVILAERMPEAKVMVVSLSASSQGAQETPETHGFRHLIEHLMLKGRKKDMDLRLEREGMFLTASTYRDVMQVNITCTPPQLDRALEAIGEVLEPLQVTQKEIEVELNIMSHELALQSDSQRLNTPAWLTVFEKEGLEPIGNLEAMRKATPELLLKTQEALFHPGNLALVVVGSLDVDTATAKASALLRNLPKREPLKPTYRPEGKPGRVETSDGFGEARGAIVPSFSEPQTAWALAAGMGIASQHESSFLGYSISDQHSVMLVGITGANAGLGSAIDAMTEYDEAQIFPIGKHLARYWVNRQMTTPMGLATLRGALLAQGPSYRPEDLLANIEKMTWPQFRAGVAMYRKDAAVTVVGSPK